MAFEGAISSLGASRGIDGSIDRVPDPPQSLWHKLAFLSAKCETENVELLSIFEVCTTMKTKSCLEQVPMLSMID